MEELGSLDEGEWKRGVLIRGLLKWFRQTLARVTWLMAIEPGPTVNRC